MRLVALGSLVILLAVAVTITAQNSTLPADHPAISPPSQRAGASALAEQLAPAGTGEAVQPIPRKNFIDEAIFSKIQRDNIPHANLASDEEFYRRIHIDLTGRTPTDEALRAFLADTNPDKRDKLVDTLASSRAYESKFAYFFGDLYKNAFNRIGNDGKNVFHKWVKDNIHLDRPYNEMVYEDGVRDAHRECHLQLECGTRRIRGAVGGHRGQLRRRDPRRHRGRRGHQRRPPFHGRRSELRFLP
jgi:hypothetical protein